MARAVVAGNALRSNAEKRRRDLIGSEIPRVLDGITLLKRSHEKIRRRNFVRIALARNQFSRNLSEGTILRNEIAKVLVEEIASRNADEVVVPTRDLEV